MGFLKKFAQSPAALLACLVAGGLMGAFFPALGNDAAVLGQIYLGVVAMAALPLLVVATFFGLRQTLALPQPGKRSLMIIALAAVLVAACAALGTLVGAAAEPGRGLTQSQREYLGAMVQQAGRAAGDTELTLAQPEDTPAPPPEHFLAGVFPDNFFKALADGKSLGILVCAISFGLAFAALSRNQNNALAGVFEGIYRALEIIISRVNLFIPLMVFGMAAYFAAGTHPSTLAAMGGFLAWFLLLAACLMLVALAMIGRQCERGIAEVMAALKVPSLVALTSASTTAGIPATIEAMSNRLGFSRGIVELVTPFSSVFLRCGSALYYALLTVFVANLYGRPLGPPELALVCLGAFLAAFASAGNNSIANVGYAGMVLGMLQLPSEAALALFLAIDLICEGPRNLLTLLFTCLLIALVSRGLPSERSAAELPAVEAVKPIRFAFTRSDLLVGAACSVVVAALLVLLGMGVGMRRGADSAPTATNFGLQDAGVKRE